MKDWDVPRGKPPQISRPDGARATLWGNSDAGIIVCLDISSWPVVTLIADLLCTFGNRCTWVLFPQNRVLTENNALF
jgi:hypothetical protein